MEIGLHSSGPLWISFSLGWQMINWCRSQKMNRLIMDQRIIYYSLVICILSVFSVNGLDHPKRDFVDIITQMASTQADYTLNPSRYTPENTMRGFYMNKSGQLVLVDMEDMDQFLKTAEQTVTIVFPGRYHMISDFWITDLCKQLAFCCGKTTVVVADWSPISYLPSGLESIDAMGQHTASIIGTWKRKFIFVGVFEGCHLAGAAASYLSQKVEKLFCLDPSDAKRITYFQSHPLQTSNIQFVQVIHTSAGSYGEPNAIGDQDWFVNNKTFPQPGCESNDFQYSLQCNRVMAIDLFYYSINKHSNYYDAQHRDRMGWLTMGVPGVFELTTTKCH